MTKEQFLGKWGLEYAPTLKADLDAVIASEIEQAKGEEIPAPKYPIGGYAPGHYACICVNCKEQFMGDKRAVQCELCAVKTTSQPTEPVTEQPTPNPIREAYDAFKPIRAKVWGKDEYIKNYSDTEFIDERGKLLYHHDIFDFDRNPEKWELYTEAQAEQVTKQPAPFDQDRYERMFRAVVIASPHDTYERCMEITNDVLKQLDAYYASKKGGEND